MIKNFLLLSAPLNQDYLPLYATEKGSKYKFKLKKYFNKIFCLLIVNECLINLFIYCLFSICLENAYNETLESVKKSFPQYIRELEGVADGAQVEFYKVSKVDYYNCHVN